MKKKYSKPTIHVEVMSLDMPVAAACQQMYDYPELSAQGWFIGKSCSFDYAAASGDKGWIADTLCYHSHVTTMFGS